MDNSDEFSDELDEFEESQDDSNVKKKVYLEIEVYPLAAATQSFLLIYVNL